MSNVADDDTFWNGSPEELADRLRPVRRPRLPDGHLRAAGAVRRRDARAVRRRGEAAHRRRVALGDVPTNDGRPGDPVRRGGMWASCRARHPAPRAGGRPHDPLRRRIVRSSRGRRVGVLIRPSRDDEPPRWIRHGISSSNDTGRRYSLRVNVWPCEDTLGAEVVRGPDRRGRDCSISGSTSRSTSRSRSRSGTSCVGEACTEEPFAAMLVTRSPDDRWRRTRRPTRGSRGPGRTSAAAASC